jgi:hypothetical protein
MHLTEEQRRFLRSDEIQAMSAHVDFQAHTVGHLRLPFISYEEALAQVSNCRRRSDCPDCASGSTD